MSDSVSGTPKPTDDENDRHGYSQPTLAQYEDMRRQRDDARQALAVIGELTVADRPYDWRIEQIVRTLDSARRSGAGR